MTQNKQGLSRSIGEKVKRTIRKRCGFGCVICGCAVYEYHHFGTAFSQANVHDPESITLLCPTCHGQITRGIWSDQKAIEANGSPKALEDGFSTFYLDVAPKADYQVRIGQFTFSNLQEIVTIDGACILGVQPPEETGTPPRIQAMFFDRNGELAAEIVNNEWIGSTDEFDIENNGPRLKVRSAPRKIDLELVVEPPNGIRIERIEMSYGDKKISTRHSGRFVASANEYTLSVPDSPQHIEQAPFWLKLTDRIYLGSDEAISAGKHGITKKLPGAVEYKNVDIEINEDENGEEVQTLSFDGNGGYMALNFDLAAFDRSFTNDLEFKKQLLRKIPAINRRLLNRIEKLIGKELGFLKSDSQTPGFYFDSREAVFTASGINETSIAHICTNIVLLHEYWLKKTPRVVAEDGARDSVQQQCQALTSALEAYYLAKAEIEFGIARPTYWISFLVSLILQTEQNRADSGLLIVAVFKMLILKSLLDTNYEINQRIQRLLKLVDPEKVATGVVQRFTQAFPDRLKQTRIALVALRMPLDELRIEMIDAKNTQTYNYRLQRE